MSITAKTFIFHKRTNFNPYAGSLLVPVHESYSLTDEKAYETIPIEEIQNKCDNYAYARNEKETVEHCKQR